MTDHTQCRGHHRNTVWALRLELAWAHNDRPAVAQIRDEIGHCIQCWWNVVEALIRAGYYNDLNDHVLDSLRGEEDWETAKARVAADRRASIVRILDNMRAGLTP